VTAKDITLALCLPRYAKGFCLPRYTPKGWFECDVAEFTAAGYLREYEIKISRADFKADVKKRASLSYYAHRRGIKGKLKHEQLQVGDACGPVQFWYVVPRGLVQLNEVPEFAGLIEMSEHSSPAWRAKGYMQEHEAKPAPRLHAAKLEQAVIRHAHGVCYWRLHKTMAQNWRLGRLQVRNTELLRAYGWPKIGPKK
jgi:hypothetical protein